MDIDHVHFYIKEGNDWENWFVKTLNCHAIAHHQTAQTNTTILKNGAVYFLISTPTAPDSPIAHYLQRHPDGVADIAFRVSHLKTTLTRFTHQGGTVVRSPQSYQGTQETLRWAVVQGWGDLCHTLVERTINESSHKRSQNVPTLMPLPDGGVQEFLLIPHSAIAPSPHSKYAFTGIDHVVLNVEQGKLSEAIAQYEQRFGFERGQEFRIQTRRSALASQVLSHPDGSAQLPMNEPASPTSQIQEFLTANRGAGVQHLALQTPDILSTIAHLRHLGMTFLRVPPTYYQQLRYRRHPPLPEAFFQAIAAQEVLVDWQIENPKALLLQAFSHPIFDQPTFFFELIERQFYLDDHQLRQVKGFGEGNFQALFEAVEQEQIKRGNLE